VYKRQTRDTTASLIVGGGDVVAYRYSLDSDIYGDETDVGTSIGLTDLPDGTHTVYVIGRDEAGNWQHVPTTATWTVDTTSPVATVTGAPQSPTTTTAATLTVGGNGVVAYRYSLDSRGYGDETEIGTRIELTGLSDDEHSVSVLGRDEAGNWQDQEEATTVSWTVDTTPPEPPVITTDGGDGPGEDFITHEPDLVLEGTCSSDTWSLKLNGDEVQSFVPESVTWSCEILLAEGENLLRVHAFDLAGNQSSPESVTVTYYPPLTLTVADSSDAPGSTVDVLVTFTGTREVETFTLEVRYDPLLLEYQELVREGHSIENFDSVECTETSDGVAIEASRTGGSLSIEDEVLLALRLRVGDEAATGECCELRLENVTGGLADCDTRNGTFCVAPTLEMEGGLHTVSRYVELSIMIDEALGIQTFSFILELAWGIGWANNVVAVTEGTLCSESSVTTTQLGVDQTLVEVSMTEGPLPQGGGTLLVMEFEPSMEDTVIATLSELKGDLYGAASASEEIEIAWLADSDGDGYSDVDEEANQTDPHNETSMPADYDGDFVSDLNDKDDDGDGVFDSEDELPFNPAEWKDTDGDGIGNNSDDDDDNDGLFDINELRIGTDPEDRDSDGDGYWDGFELDHGTSPVDPQDFPPDTDVYGDVDVDGYVNAMDVQLVINGTLNPELIPVPIRNADINGDGIVNAIDVQLVINTALGIVGQRDKAKILTSPRASHHVRSGPILTRIIPSA